MSVSKIKKDIQLLEQQLNEIENIITDPIERIEQKKQLEKEIKKLERSLDQIESLAKEQQELEFLRVECLSSDRYLVDEKECDQEQCNFADTNNLNSTIDKLSQKKTISTFVSSQPISLTPTSNTSNKSSTAWFNLKYIALLVVIISNIITIALIINFNLTQKEEQARLQELARQATIKAQEEADKARQQQAKAEREKQEAIVAQKEAEKTKQEAIQAKKKADNLIKNNLYIESITTASPIEFIREHYSNLNNRNYDLKWQHLTPQFKAKSKSFYEYTAWWNSVQNIQIGQIELLEQNNNRAVVDVQLKYFMKKGTIYEDPQSTIYLIWDSEFNSWMFEDKQ